MKRMVCALLAFTLLFGLSGCKKDSEDRLEVSQEETVLEPETEDWTEEETEEFTEEDFDETFDEALDETTEETQLTVVPCEEHTWGEWVRWEKPTTTTEGKRVRTCTVCGEEDVEIEPTLPKTTSHKHKYKVEQSKATCLEDGWAYYYCTCGDWYQVTLKATGHDWGDWVFTTIPTETSKGVKTRTCKSCKETEEEETPSFKEHSHKFYDFRNEPTCTKAGSKGQICSVCGYKESTKIAALGHNWGSWKVTKAATEDAKGVETRTCKRCNTKETRSIDKLPHTTHKWETKEVVAPTCEEEGYTLRRCKVCGQEEKVDVTPATSHTYEWKVIQEPGCESEGEKAEVCTVCGAKGTTVPLPATGHVWSDWELNEDGTKEERICDNCEATETRDVDESAWE